MLNRNFRNGVRRVWTTVGVATQTTTNKAGRQIDENDEIVAREAKAIRGHRNLTPARTRRYEEHPASAN